MKFFHFFLFVLINTFLWAQSGSLKKGYFELKRYNYFAAKSCFEKRAKKEPFGANYGLALIYFRKDNPFHRLDSAFSKINLAEKAFANVSPKSRLKYQTLGLDSLSILSTKLDISSAIYLELKKQNSVDLFQDFITAHPWAYEKNEAIFKRDSLAFDLASKVHTSSAYQQFIQTYPNSDFKTQAQSNYDLTLFQEQTNLGTIVQFEQFIGNFTNSPYVKEAQDQLFYLLTKNNTIAEYDYFVHHYSNNPHFSEAWQKLYQLFMMEYSIAKYDEFKLKYPDYPFYEELEREKLLAKEVWYPYKKNGLMGFINDLGEVKIEAQYQNVSFFKEGLALVLKDDLYGFIDKKNHLVIPCKFDAASDFEEGRAIVEKEDQMGMIDRNGTFILPLTFEDIGQIKYGLCEVKEGNSYSYYDKNGKVKIEGPYAEAFSFQPEGVVAIDSLYGLIDTLGNVKINPLYNALSYLNDTLLIFEKDGLLGLISNKGLEITKPEYQTIGRMIENRILVSKNNKLGYLNEKGSEVIPCIFEPFSNYQNLSNFKGLYAKVKQKGKFGIIDLTGKVIIPFVYQNLGEVASVIAFTKGKKWGYIDLKNKLFLATKYEKAESFIDNLAIVEDKGKFGLINLKGEIYIPYDFDELQRVNERFIFAKKNEKWGVFSNDGKVVVPIIYQQIQLLGEDFVILYKEDAIEYLYLPENRWIKINN